MFVSRLQLKSKLNTRQMFSNTALHKIQEPQEVAEIESFSKLLSTILSLIAVIERGMTFTRIAQHKCISLQFNRTFEQHKRSSPGMSEENKCRDFFVGSGSRTVNSRIVPLWTVVTTVQHHKSSDGSDAIRTCAQSSTPRSKLNNESPPASLEFRYRNRGSGGLAEAPNN